MSETRIIASRNVWTIILACLTPIEKDFLIRQFIHKKVPDGLILLAEALQKELNQLVLARTALLNEIFAVTYPLNIQEGCVNYVACYQAQQMNLRWYMLLCACDVSNEQTLQAYHLPQSLKNHMRNIIGMLAEDPSNKLLIDELLLASVTHRSTQIAVMCIENGATPPDFSRIFNSSCYYQGRLSVDKSMIQLMDAIFKHHPDARSWFLKEKKSAYLYVVEMFRLSVLDYTHRAHLSQMLQMEDFTPYAHWIYRIVLDDAIDTWKRPDFTSDSSVRSYKRIKNLGEICRFIHFLIADHKFPRLGRLNTAMDKGVGQAGEKTAQQYMQIVHSVRSVLGVDLAADIAKPFSELQQMFADFFKDIADSLGEAILDERFCHHSIISHLFPGSRSNGNVERRSLLAVIEEITTTAKVADKKATFYWGR